MIFVHQPRERSKFFITDMNVKITKHGSYLSMRAMLLILSDQGIVASCVPMV